MSAICDSCDKFIPATREDPMVHTSWGREHYRCMQLRTTGRTNEAEATPPRTTLSVAAPVPETPGGRGSYTCGNCGGSGHNARRCTGLGTAPKRKSTDLVYDDTADASEVDPRRIVPVTDDALDAPDGAIVNGRKRVGEVWVWMTDEEVEEVAAQKRIEQRKREREAQ